MDSKFQHRLVMKKNRVAKILGQNFIFGRKKIGLGLRGYGVDIFLMRNITEVSMRRPGSVYVLTFYH
jgi:hypothetical protein